MNTIELTIKKWLTSSTDKNSMAYLRDLTILQNTPVLQRRTTILITGQQGVGKTTLKNALKILLPQANLVISNERKTYIEDAHTIHLQASDTNISDIPINGRDEIESRVAKFLTKIGWQKSE